jgi:hypothetical protein
MMKSKIAIMLIALVTVVLIVSFGCDKKQKKAPAEKTEVVEESQKEISKPSAEMNDDIYLDIMAHKIYLPDKYNKKYGKKVQTDPEIAEKFLADFNKDMEKLYKKYGVTEDAFENYTEVLTKNIEHYTKVMERVNERVKELEKAEKY